MNMIDILKQQHAELIATMDKLAALKNSQNNATAEKKQLFEKFKSLYRQHDEIEDEIVYPTLYNEPELAADILKSYQAHHMVEIGLLELKLLPYQSETWLPKFLVIRDSVLTHMAEEEDLIFPKAQQLLSAEALNTLSEKVNAQSSA